ncbi:Type 11 methyltransferase [Candidatus Methylobacter favarea]|uniref:Type 11 methyltransferase n=1 Tax=Candidatus Methylobacter favarea TaxID=2707345 RepID=A0A8S0XTV3_9GAMM|nr:Type 11 methyltransferase [Candidatus Methylobacter favarea]
MKMQSNEKGLETVKPLSEELEEIEMLTLSHYNQHADAFWEGTKDHDVTQNYAAFLAPFPAGKKLDILDFGCGPGRDIRYFQSLGHRPTGLDGSEKFCRMARRYTGCQILQQTFLNLNLPRHAFDGIFANASLFHVPSLELPRVLNALQDALRPDGILFLSNPRGNNEGWFGQRYGHYMELEVSKTYLEQSGFEIIHYYYRPSGRPIHEQPWLAIVCRSAEQSMLRDNEGKPY